MEAKKKSLPDQVRDIAEFFYEEKGVKNYTLIAAAERIEHLEDELKIHKLALDFGADMHAAKLLKCGQRLERLNQYFGEEINPEMCKAAEAAIRSFPEDDQPKNIQELFERVPGLIE
jgi:hypothetical protein